MKQELSLQLLICVGLSLLTIAVGQTFVIFHTLLTFCIQELSLFCYSYFSSTPLENVLSLCVYIYMSSFIRLQITTLWLLLPPPLLWIQIAFILLLLHFTSVCRLQSFQHQWFLYIYGCCRGKNEGPLCWEPRLPLKPGVGQNTATHALPQPGISSLS